VYKEHTGFVSDKGIHYLYIYDLLFSHILETGKPITILEIGVQNGGSLEIWKKYFPENSRIHGIDINEKCRELKFSDNISFHLGSAADSDFMNQTFKDIEFDIILDDGSHICREVIKTFVNMFPKLKTGGIYVVEDIHTSYYRKSYGGGFRKNNTSIEFFKKLIEALNLDYIPKNKMLFLSNKEIVALKEYNKMIKQISFYNAVCAITKYNQLKTDMFQPVYTGEIEDVFEISPYRKSVIEQQELINKIGEIYLGKNL
jgi:cephalosporin hydroxylase